MKTPYKNYLDNYRPIFLVCFKDKKKVAEMDITITPSSELEVILEVQEILGRVWEYQFR